MTDSMQAMWGGVSSWFSWVVMKICAKADLRHRGRVSGRQNCLVFFLLRVLFLIMQVKNKAASLRLFAVPLEASLPASWCLWQGLHSLSTGHLSSGHRSGQ